VNPARGFVLPAALFSLAVLGAAPIAAGQEAPPAPATQVPGESKPGPRGERFLGRWALASGDLEDGELVICLVEGVTLSRGTFSLEARNTVLWCDNERLRKEGGPLGDLARPVEGAAEGAVPAPGAKPDKPRVDVPADLREALGDVVHALYAEGDVKFTLETRTIRTERLYIDFRRGILTTGKVQMTASLGIPSRGMALPLVVRAAKMRQVSHDTFRLEDAAYTTCNFAEPHFEFRCTELDITMHEETRTFTGYRNVLWVEGIPCFYLPVLSGSSTLSARPLKTATYRASNRFGSEFLLTWGDDISVSGSRWGEWTVHTDWRTRRGGGIGPEVKYDYGDYEGELKTYYQKDRARTDEFDDSLVPREDRGRVQWEHRHKLAKNLRLDLSLFDFSDRNFQQEYYKEEALEDRDPESYAYLRYAKGRDFATLSGKIRIDDFRTETEEKPEVALRRIGARAPGSLVPSWLLDRVTYSVDVRGGSYERKVDEATAAIQGEAVSRADAVARVEGLKWVGPVSFSPFGTAGSTFTGGGDLAGRDRDERRGDLAAGIRAHVEARREFQGVESRLFDLKGLRHVVDLEGMYYDRWTVSGDSSPLDPVDRVDALEEVRVGSLRFRNRLQTMRAGQRVDWIDLELRGLWFPSGLEGQSSPLRFREEGLEEARFQDFVGEEKYRARTLAQELGPYEADMRVRLREGLFLLGEGEYDPDRHRLATSVEGVRWFVVPQFSVYLGRREILDDSDIYTVSADWFLSPRWTLHASNQTDRANDEGLKTEIGLRRIWHDFVLEVTFKSDQTTDDRSLAFSLIPSALFESPTSPDKLGKLDYDAQRWYR